MSSSGHLEFQHNILSYMTEIARGNVPNASLFSSFGELETAGAVSNHLVWPLAGTPDLVVPPSPGVQMTLVSDSADDDKDAGTGIRSLIVHYLDVNLDAQQEEVELEGLTPVTTTATDIQFVQCVHIKQYGSGTVAAGDITISHGGTAYSFVKTGDRRCSSSARRVPNGKTFFLHAMWSGSASGTAAASSTTRLVATNIAGHDFTTDGLTYPHASISVQDSSEALTMMQVMPFPAGTVLAMEVSADKGAVISGGFAGWIEDN